MVVCPRCGHKSEGRFICDRCRALIPFEVSAKLPTNTLLPSGRVVDLSGFAGEFPADAWQAHSTLLDGVPLRVYALSRSWWEDLADRIQQRVRQQLPGLAPLEVVPLEEGWLVLASGLIGATCPLLQPPPDDLLARLNDTLALCRLLERVLSPLHQAGWIWLNFDPATLHVAGQQVQITSLDLALFAQRQCPTSVRLSTAYSPPELFSFRAERLGPATDVFHVALYAYYRLAGLLPDGFPGQGLEAFQFEIPPLRIYQPTLPPGIAPVLQRGLAREPSDRFASVRLFVEALAEAVDQAHARLGGTQPLRFDLAGGTAIGRTHVAMGLPNQDAYAILPGKQGLVALVADGVTLTRIGSGELASSLAVEVLSRHLTPNSTEEEVAQACVEATAAILQAALQVAPKDEPIDPCDWMSTTIVAAVIRGNELLLASAGDSRAYLISNGQAEQLTVDGDVRCVYLAAGYPPEQLRELGADAFALYHCLGVGETTESGQLVPCLDRCTPRVRRWKLQPGDVLILCSDGLIEEGGYLEPFELPQLIQPDSPASALVEQLVAAAVSRHREPTDWEPEGHGDDVTCVVIRVLAGG